MELGHLKYFYHVALEGGFTKAARKLHIEQPSVSRAIQKLEADLGVLLFERQKRRVQLTRAGSEVFKATQRIFTEAENIKNLAQNESSVHRGPLYFAVASPFSTHLIPEVHSMFLKDHPEVRPVSFQGPASAMLDRIENGELEFGLFYHVPKLTPTLKSEILAKVPFKLVISAGQFRNENVRCSFIGSREVDDIATKAFPTLEKIKKDHPEAAIKISSNDLTAHKEMVLRGLGVSILPQFMVKKELESGLLKALYDKEEMNFAVRLVTRKGQILSKVATDYVRMFTQVL